MSCLNHFSPIQTTTPLTETPFLTEKALNERQILLKFVVIGDASAGKTSIVHKLLQNTFNANYTPTDGNHHSPTSEEITIDCNDEDSDKKYVIQLQLWDTTGILPSDINIPSTLHDIPSSLKSKKHPKSFPSLPSETNVNQNNNDKHNVCLLPNIAAEKELDLASFFDEFDAKEAMEECRIYKPPNNNNNGYSSSSSSSSAATEQAETAENMENVEKQSVFDELVFSSLDALILVYDVTNKESLINLNGWIGLFAKNSINSSEVPILIMGNKNDLSQKRVVSRKAGGKFTQQLVNPLKFFREVSAKNDSQKQIQSIFIELARKCIHTQSTILQLTSCDSICSQSTNQAITTSKRMQRNYNFAVKTCAHNLCRKDEQDMDQRTFCVVL